MRMPARTDANDRDKIIDCIISIVGGIKCGTVTLNGGTADRTIVKNERTKGLNEGHTVLLTPTNAAAAADVISTTLNFAGAGILRQFDQFVIRHHLETQGERTFNWIAIAR